MRYVQGNDIYLNIFRMLIGRSVPEAVVVKISMCSSMGRRSKPRHKAGRRGGGYERALKLVSLIFSSPQPSALLQSYGYKTSGTPRPAWQPFLGEVIFFLYPIARSHPDTACRQHQLPRLQADHCQ